MPPEVGTPADWMRRARADLALAAAPLPQYALYEDLCWHAQQAAEKAVKAVLLALQIPFPRTHILERLIGLLPESVPCPPDLLAAEALSQYASQSRYPGDEEPVLEAEYREALRLAAAVVEWAEAALAPGAGGVRGTGEEPGRA